MRENEVNKPSGSCTFRAWDMTGPRRLMLAVDGTEVVDGEFGLAVGSNLSDLILRGLLKGLDQGVVTPQSQ